MAVPVGSCAKAPGHAPKLNDAQRQALVQIVESGPIPVIHGVVRWRLRDLAWWIFEEFGTEPSIQSSADSHRPTSQAQRVLVLGTKLTD